MRMHRLGGPLTRLSGPALLALGALGASGLGLGAAAGAATPAASVRTFTWTGSDSAAGTSSSWSDANNWKGGKAPNENSTVNLVFPALACVAAGPCGNLSDNDVTGLTVASFTLHLGQGSSQPAPGAYELSGDAITVEALTVTTPKPKSGDIANLAEIGLPITVAENQTWTIGVNGGGQPLFLDPITGTGNLTVSSSGFGFIGFQGGVNVGTLDFVGVDSSDTGQSAGSNGTIASFGNLNADGNPVNLTDVGFFSIGSGTLGPLTTSGDDLQVGNGGGGGPYGIEAVDGNAVLDSGTYLDLWGLTPGTGKKPVAGKTYTQIAVDGSLALNSANLYLYADCNQNIGTSYKIIDATSPLTGTFAGIANNSLIQAGPDSGNSSCSAAGSVGPWLRIHYDDAAGTVTATVAAPPPGPGSDAGLHGPTTHAPWRATMEDGHMIE
jgi:hypothetical protein